MRAELPRLRILRALLVRDYLLSRSYRAILILDLLFGMLNLVIYYFISETFGEPGGARFGGAPSYFAFAAVGAALATVVQAASTRVATRIREEQLTGTLELLVAQPITPAEICIGLVGFQFLFAIVRTTVYLLAAWLLLNVDLSHADWIGFTLVLFATALALAGIGMILAAGVLVLKRAELLVGAVTLVLAILGGAYFPVSVLPGWLEPLSTVVPSRFAFDGARSALFGGAGWGSDVLVLVVFGAIGVPVAVFVFRVALAFTKRRGSLATY